MVQGRKGYGGSLATRLNAYFQTVDFPAHKDELMEAARAHGAEEKFIETLDRLEDREYNTFDEVANRFERFERMGTMHVEGDGHDIGRRGPSEQAGMSAGPSAPPAEWPTPDEELSDQADVEIHEEGQRSRQAQDREQRE
jgi:hypothetical protein